MIDYEEEFNMSYWRATQSIVDGVEFVDSFKNRLVASSEEIQTVFVHSTGEALRSGLVLALVHLASYYPDYEPDRTLEDITHRHNRHARAIKPHLYDLFLDCMIETVADYDPEYEEHVGASSRRGWSTSNRSIRARLDNRRGLPHRQTLLFGPFYHVLRTNLLDQLWNPGHRCRVLAYTKVASSKP